MRKYPDGRPNGSGHRLTRRGQEPPLRCLWQIQRGGFKAAPRLMDTNVSARRLAQRGPHSRGGDEYQRAAPSRGSSLRGSILAGSNSPPDCCSQLQRPDGRVKLELVSSHSILFAPKNKTTLWVVLFFGAGDEARTRYLDLGKVALYQMSYARKMVPQAGVEPATRGFSVRCSTN